MRVRLQHEEISEGAKTNPFMASAAAEAVSLEERVFMGVSQVVVIVDGEILRAILKVLRRYLASDRPFPVSDGSLFTGKSQMVQRDFPVCFGPYATLMALRDPRRQFHSICRSRRCRRRSRSDDAARIGGCDGFAARMYAEFLQK